MVAPRFRRDVSRSRAPRGSILGIELYDERGRPLLAVNDGPSGAGETIPDFGLEPGRTYFLRIHEIGAGRPPVSHNGHGGAYTLTWIPREPRPFSLLEPNDDAAHAVSMPLGVDLDGFYGKKHDEDWLKVALGRSRRAPRCVSSSVLRTR